MGFQKNFTNSNKSYHNSGDSFGLSIDFETTKPIKLHNSSSTRTSIGIMDLVYSFTETSRIKVDRSYFSMLSPPSVKSKMNCKYMANNCTTTSTSSLARSYLVGGFVGSKSQIGRRRKDDVGKFNLWDIIRDLVDLVGNVPVNYPQKQNHPTSSFDKAWEIKHNDKTEKQNHYRPRCIGSNCSEPSSSLKQSYADIAKRTMKDHQCIKLNQSEKQPSTPISNHCDIPKSVIEPISLCNKTSFTNKERITSECSVDSEDSFIVFECCDDDNLDKDIFSSDDETISQLEEVSQSDSGIEPTSNSSYVSKNSPKKVRFADGKSLAKVYPMVTWDYAYRMARRGPWEMLARDSERFKLRIARTEAVLKPILDPEHRSVVFRDRFSDLVR